MPPRQIPLLPNCIYHIYNHANGKENLFENKENYNYFMKRYAYFINPIADTFAYCQMPNHVHFMVRIKDTQDLQIANKNFLLAKEIPLENIKEIKEEDFSKFVARTFANLFSSYAQAFNIKTKRKGGLFIPNFKRKEVTSQTYYTKLIHYIHNNPIHHGFVKDLESWAYSSYNAYILEKATLLAKAEVINWFGDKNAFQDFHTAEKVDFSFDDF